MQKLKINLNQKPVHILKTIDLIEMSRIPVKAVLMLKSELALFQGSTNRSKEYIEKITAALKVSPSITEDFLRKSIGTKDKVPGLFKLFNKSFAETAKEMKYFGSLMLSNESNSSLQDFLDNPKDKDMQNAFLESLRKTIETSEEKINSEVEELEIHLTNTINDALATEELEWV